MKYGLQKDKDGISEIYALSDYILEDDKNAGKKVRNDATYNKDYLTEDMVLFQYWKNLI